MVNINQIMKQVAANTKIHLVPGAIAMSWKGQDLAFLGLPIGEIVPEGIRKSLESSQDASAEAEWNQMFHTESSEEELTFRTSVNPGELITKHEVGLYRGERRVGWVNATQEAGSKSFLISEAELEPELRGQGLGKKLYQGLFSHAKEVGATEVASSSVVSEQAQGVWRSLASGAPIVEEMGKAGPKFSLNVAKFVSESAHLAPVKRAIIGGLPERGVGRILRKFMTSFGSGFQGIKPQMTAPERFLKLVGATEESIRATDIQHRRYQGNELEGLVQAFKQGKPVEPAEIFVDEFKNIIGAEGRHRALAAKKAGVELPVIIRRRAPSVQEVEKIARAAMDTGEGAAICRAGTAQVPSVLRATSRIIKSAL